MSIVLDTKDFGEVRDVKGGVVGSLGEVASTVLGSKNTVSSGNVESVNNVGSIGNVGSLGNVDLGSIGSLGNTGSLNNVNETKKLVNLELTSSATTVNAASEAKVEVKPEPVAYKQYKYRYIIMFLYFLLSNASGITGPVCAPIITNLTKIYGVSQTVVNLSTLISMIVYIPATIPGNWILERYGIKVGIIIGTALMVGGVWLRLLAKTSFTWVLLGQLLASIGGPLLSNCPQKISAYWTAPGSRTMFTTLLMLSGVVGGSLGFILPGWIVGEESSPELGKELFVKLLLIEAIVCSVLCIPVFIFFREKPPTPPCASAEVKRESDRAGYKLLLKNRPFLWLLAQQGCVLGAINALITTIQSLIDPFGYTQYQASAMGVIVNVASVLGCLIFGCYVQKVRKFKMPMIYSGFIALACYGMFTGVIYSHNFYALAGVTFVLGFVLAPCGPLALEFACEITFPVGEALSGGIILSIIQVVCPAQTFIIGAIMEREDKRQGTLYTMIMLMVFMVVGILCSFKIKEDLKRSAHDRNHGKAAEKAKEETPETPCPLVENVEVSPADVIIQETKKPEAL